MLTSAKWSILVLPGHKREIDDVMLTVLYACYFIAQNDDPRKEQRLPLLRPILPYQTCRAELIEQRILEQESLSARRKLTQTKKS